MSIREKVAFLQGLAEGMNIDDTDEGRVLSAIIDILEDISDSLDELNENALDIGEELNTLSDDLAEVEDFLENLDGDADDDADNFEDYDDDGWDDYDYDSFEDNDFGDADSYKKYSCCDVCGVAGGKRVADDVDEPESSDTQAVQEPPCGVQTQTVAQVPQDEASSENASSTTIDISEAAVDEFMARLKKCFEDVVDKKNASVEPADGLSEDETDIADTTDDVDETNDIEYIGDTKDDVYKAIEDLQKEFKEIKEILRNNAKSSVEKPVQPADEPYDPFDVNCPECGAAIALTADDIAYQQVSCPSCGKDIDLEIDEDDPDEEF